MEELSQMVIIQPSEDNQMHASFEYDTKSDEISAVIGFTGPDFDPDAPEYFISWPIIGLHCTDLEYSIKQKGKFNNVLRFKIK